MGVSEILASIDREIAQLKQARALLGGGAGDEKKSGRGRPGRAIMKRRVLSPEGRRRIAEAQKKRWAAQKRATQK